MSGTLDGRPECNQSGFRRFEIEENHMAASAGCGSRCSRTPWYVQNFVDHGSK